MKRQFLILCLISLVFTGGIAQNKKLVAARHPFLEESVVNELKHSIFLGLKYLNSIQQTDGSWEHYPAITGLCLSAYMRSPFEFKSSDSSMQAGYSFLEKFTHPDGSIWGPELPSYNTAICVAAFKDAQDARYKSIIMNAEKYLMSNQYDENKGYTRDSLNYGGVGYGNGKTPDMSNLIWAINALQSQEKPEIEKSMSPEEKKLNQEKKLFYDRALVFLSRCQNLKSVNTASYAGNDGGFMYGPGVSKAESTNSYGSMTYAGLMSMIYAQLSKNDPRVIAAFNWISQNFMVDQNPKLGTDGLYYYYHTMASALSVYGQETVKDSDGKDRKWREELGLQLVRLQNADGSWVNSNGRWRENNKTLVTAYVVLSLEKILLYGL